MFSDCGEDEVVFESSCVTEGSVAYHDNEVDVVRFVAKDGLEPWFIDEFVDWLTCRDEFVVAYINNDILREYL